MQTVPTVTANRRPSAGRGGSLAGPADHTPATTKPDAGPLVYVAHPMTSYGTDHEARALAALARLLPDVELVNPATRYGSNVDWLTDWPRLVRSLAGLVVVADEHGTVGAGVLREVTDCLFRGVPLAVLDGRGRLRELAGLDLLTPEDRTPAAVAWPVEGAPVAPAALCRTLTGTP